MKKVIASILLLSLPALAASPGYVYNAILCYTGAPVGATAVGQCVNATNAALDSVSKVSAYAKRRGDTLFVALHDSTASIRSWAASEFTTPADVGSIVSSQVPGMLTGYATQDWAQIRAYAARDEAVVIARAEAEIKYTTPAYVSGALAGALTPYATRAQVGDTATVLRALMVAIAHDTANARLAAYFTSAQTLTRIGDTASALRVLIAALPSLATVQAQADSIARFRGRQDSLYARQRDSALFPAQPGWTAATGTAHKGAFNASASTTVGAVVVLGVSLPVYADVQNLSALLLEARQRIKALEDAARSKERPGP